MKKRLEPHFWKKIAIVILGIIIIIICSGRILEAYDKGLIPMDMFVITAAIIMRAPASVFMTLILVIFILEKILNRTKTSYP